MGLRCRVEEVAASEVGRVCDTVPAPGAWFDRSGEIVLRVGVAARVETIVPRVRRLSVDEATAAYGDIYAMALRPVRGPARLEGRVLRQSPRAGERLPFRGLLTLEVVDNTIMVPDLSNLGMRRAIREIEALGLRADIREVLRHDVRRPTVIRQRPRAGSRLRAGEAVRLRVAVPERHLRRAHPELLDDLNGLGHRHGHPRAERHQAAGHARFVLVPNVTGLRLDFAQQQLEAAGLLGETRDDTLGPRATVSGQSLAAGTRVAAGSRVQLRVERGRARGRYRIGGFH